VSMGPFLVRGLLGEGGMGTVYRAFDPQLCREVALKVIKPEMASCPTARKRFHREAQAVARIQNDHIVSVWPAWLNRT
jgi:serine/threonine-protein kinase